jgi:hypothetical protein
MLGLQERRLLERDALRFLVERATVSRPTETIDRYGVARHAYTTVAADVPCRVAPAETRYDQTPERIRLAGDVTLVFLRDADVRVGDIVAIGGRQFRVTSVTEPVSLGIVLKVVAEAME